MKNYQKKKGFTLIELLVVVLIIGILSAIALPQYQTAVDKARMGRLMSLTRSIADAQERYYMANGSYSDEVGNLDISFPEADIYDCNSGGRNTQCIKIGKDHCALQSASGYSYCVLRNYMAQYGIFLKNKNTTPRFGQVTCITLATSQQARGIKLCSALGGKLKLDSEDGKYYSLD